MASVGKPSNESSLRPSYRLQAEAQLRAAPSVEVQDLSVPEIESLLHELRVHQIELEMQNEELVRHRESLEIAREKYFDLYDLAPVGYLTLTETGEIAEANLHAATLLSTSRDVLLGRPLHDFVAPEDQDVWYLARKRLRGDAGPVDCAMRLRHGSEPPRWVAVDMTAGRSRTGGADVLRVTMRDITARKDMEEEVGRTQGHLRALVEQLSRAEERERRRLSSELHDQLAQMLAACKIILSRAGDRTPRDEMAKIIAEALQSVDAAMVYTRTLLAQLSPRVLYDFGLPAALVWLGQSMAPHGLAVEIDTLSTVDVQQDQAVVAFQCTRELLWNVVKHAGVGRANIRCRLEGGALVVEVTDEGRGFDPHDLGSGESDTGKFGLFSIRERVQLEGGRLDVESAPGQGARITLTMPARVRKGA